MPDSKIVKADDKPAPQKYVNEWRDEKRTPQWIYAGAAYREKWGIDPQQAVTRCTEAEYDRATTGWPDERI